jgi:hypothetical protein
MGRWISVGIFLLLALTISTTESSGQDVRGGSTAPGSRARGFRLEQNYPNPFNPSTRIPFVLEGEIFEGGKGALVSLRVYNVLQQLVAIPTTLDHPDGEGLPVEQLAYAEPGSKLAFWDGKDRNGREVAAGIYYLQLIVNGESQVRKMVVSR